MMPSQMPQTNSTILHLIPALLKHLELVHGVQTTTSLHSVCYSIHPYSITIHSMIQWGEIVGIFLRNVTDVHEFAQKFKNYHVETGFSQIRSQLCMYTSIIVCQTSLHRIMHMGICFWSTVTYVPNTWLLLLRCQSLLSGNQLHTRHLAIILVKGISTWTETDGDNGSMHTQCVLCTLNTASGALGSVLIIVPEASKALWHSSSTEFDPWHIVQARIWCNARL